MTPGPVETSTGDRVTLHDLEPATDRLCEDVRVGLAATPKALAPKYFYDRRGAELFERICELDAYYPTRTELGILRDNVAEIARRLGPECRVVEYGSGSGIKTRILLEHLDRPVAYLPVDISRAQLMEFALSIAADLPALQVLPICADYTAPLPLPAASRPARRTAAFFPGSTIGNFEPADAEAFLARIAQTCGEGGACVIGVDLRKDAATLEAAYNDPEGVTAEFNLNLLDRINRECGTDFDRSAFRHHAPWDPEQGRIEMRLVSTRAQTVRIPADAAGTPEQIVEFAEGEWITTEYSYKYRVDQVAALAERAGWQVEHRWCDERDWFSVWLLGRK